MPAILDTGFVLALTNARDPAHAACKRALAQERESMVAPQAILPEIGWLVSSRLGSQAEAAFFATLPATNWTLEPLVSTDFARVAELLGTYQDAKLGFVDAAVVAVAERLGAVSIYTLDRRHFSLIRPRHVEFFAILPQDL